MEKEEIRRELLNYFNALLEKRQALLARGWENFTEAIKKALDDFSIHMKVDLSPEVPENLEPLLDRVLSIAPTAAEIGVGEKPSRITVLIAGIRGMKEETSQSRLIAHLLEAVSRLVKRVILFVVKENKFIGWDGRGFPDMEETDFRRIVMPINPNSTFGKVLKMEDLYIGEFPAGREDEKVVMALGGGKPEQALILPMIVKGKSVGLVYCDELPDASPIRYPDEIEILVSYAEAMVELLPIRAKHVKEKAERRTSRFVVPQEEKMKTKTSTRVGEDTARRIPTITEEEVPPTEEVKLPREEELEVGVVEEIKEEKRVLTEEEKMLHEVARRKAKVLVSDIILYNREKIEEGKRKGNLYSELQDEIKLAIEIYKRKVDPRVKEDYLYKELVEKLAGGDPSLLQGYPGV